VTAFLGRTSPTGERAELNEFHMAHAAKGDLAVAMGPEFDIYANSKAPYIPNGDFLFVDRMMGWTGERGKLVAGATMDTEYDSPADAWYYQDNGHPFLPYCVLMETSLQSAVLLGYYLGATLPFPQEQFRIRNLDGHAAVVKDVDLRGKTIRQHSSLLFSSAMPGTILQKFRYDLSVDGEIFYTGESLFGYHTVEALSAQIGLDSSEHVPSWLDKTGTPARRIDLRGGGASRLAGAGGLRIGSGQLDLVDEIDIVDGGGDHAAGYIRGRRLVTPDEWYFSCHFHRDPVMPGSLGVEAILQAMQVYVIDTGLAADLRNPRFTMSAGVDMGWRYRGQILQTDPDMNFDIHVKRVVREPDRVVLIGDANLWKHELRIYELTDIAVAVVSGD
jgi:3-hydroxymyristoyl/3-hydroxydecanoyl-(acyl carrier protein) dehydratase